MRILYLNPSGQLGGAETVLRQILRGVRALAPDWECWLVLGEDGPLAVQAREMGVRVVLLEFPRALARLGDSGGRLVARLAGLLVAALPTAWYRHRLARILRAIQPDLIHSNGLKMHVLGAWARPSRVPLLWHIHDYVSSRLLMSRLLRRCHSACSLAIANSKSVASDFSSVLAQLRVVSIYNGIDLYRFQPEGRRLDLDAAAGLPPAEKGVIRIGLAATFARWKGQQVFLDALSRLKANSNWRGYIIGGPIYQTQGSQWSIEELRREADRLGLTGRIGFTGFVDDTAAAMRALDVVVHASTRQEPFGMVIAEAMACGKPVIVSQAGGAAELFEDGIDAVAHPPGDAAALALQIARLADDPELRLRLGQAARDHAERAFGADRFSTELLAVYQEMAGSGCSETSSNRALDSSGVRVSS